MTVHTLYPTETCPANHHAPNPSGPTHCPTWCTGLHEPRLWLRCCNIVVHSKPLETSTDGALTVRLEMPEYDTGTEPPSLTIDHGTAELDCLTPAKAEDYATTIRRAAIRARNMIGGES